MAARRSSIGIIVAISASALIYAMIFASGIAAAEWNEADSSVPMPDITRGQGENCVDETEFMRRNHMHLLVHQRDETMLQGIRNKQYSLKECVTCHTVPGPDATPVTAASPQHFCRSCHDYAAVNIDCFQCHASRPDAEAHDGTATAGAGN